MKRAAVLIGVDKTGRLPRLKDAARGAQLMKTWAEAQGLDAVHLFTDEQGPVTVDAIKRAIRGMVDAANVGQLLVYFAGHGVNLQRQEYWLLSDAPDDSNAAINVATSVALAATCGIGHVVFVSDACRTAPEGIQAQSLRGSEVFPNLEGDDAPVDQFFACKLGKPSHEVRDPAVTSGEFRALYTHELVPALLGRQPQIVEWTGDGAARRGHVRMRPLRDHLAGAVAARLDTLQLQTRVVQSPTATISSDPPLWISELKADAAGAAGGPGLGLGMARRRPAPARRSVPSADEVSVRLLRAAMQPGGAGPGPAGAGAGAIASAVGATAAAAAPTGEAVALQSRAEALSQAFGPMSHETQCGFKLRGARAVQAFAHDAHVDFNTPQPGQDLRVHVRSGRSANVLLVLDSGAGVLLPALPQFMCALSFDDDGELVDVAWEPSDNTGSRWNDYRDRAPEIRALRGIAAAAMSGGSFRLEGDDALQVAQRMQVAKGVDPALGLYAAHAYHDLQRRDLIRTMADFMAGDLGAPLFDVALLARRLDRKTVGAAGTPSLLNPLPLLSQGWALLRAFEVTLPPALVALAGHRLPSLWTMFDPQGVERLRHAITQGALR
jgi:Caspase domain